MKKKIDPRIKAFLAFQAIVSFLCFVGCSEKIDIKATYLHNETNKPYRIGGVSKGKDILKMAKETREPYQSGGHNYSETIIGDEVSENMIYVYLFRKEETKGSRARFDAESKSFNDGGSSFMSLWSSMKSLKYNMHVVIVPKKRFHQEFSKIQKE